MHLRGDRKRGGDGIHTRESREKNRESETRRQRDIVNQRVTCDRGMIALTTDRMRVRDTTMMNGRKVVNDGLGSLLKAEQKEKRRREKS